jgi:hypothetical protein
MTIWRLDDDLSKAHPQTPSASWGVLGVKPKRLMKGEE